MALLCTWSLTETVCDNEHNKPMGFPANLSSTDRHIEHYKCLGWLTVYVILLSNEQIIMNLDEKLMEIIWIFTSKQTDRNSSTLSSTTV